MVNYLFALLIILGFIISIFSGNLDKLGTAAIESANDAAKMCIGLVGSYALWLGFINVLKQAGILQKMASGLGKLLESLFKGVKRGSEAAQYISLNLCANFLGMGNAATPFGLRAMEEMQKLNQNKHIMTDAMCMFIIINASSIELLPLSVISLRTSLGSQAGGVIILPTILATSVSTLVGILCAKVFAGRK